MKIMLIKINNNLLFSYIRLNEYFLRELLPLFKKKLFIVVVYNYFTCYLYYLCHP